MSINKKIGGQKEFPEKIFLSRYYLKEKWVQVVLDVQSFSNKKTLKTCMQLPKMIFDSLDSTDRYGFKILKSSNKCDMFDGSGNFSNNFGTKNN